MPVTLPEHPPEAPYGTWPRRPRGPLLLSATLFLLCLAGLIVLAVLYPAR
ncbi:MAG: hypothetical protein IPM13_07880 [Phycisphaerales bacterium]|nr:hypothetical protein [Phycisphaerales bacterium]